MLFPTVDYLSFLPLVLLAYWLLPRGLRLGWLLIASLAFYASWSVEALWVLVAVIGVAWAGGVLQAGGRPGGRWARAAASLLILSPLLAYKYWNWLSSDAAALLHRLGLDWDPPTVAAALPVGISFFTFQAVAYVVDVGRGLPAERSPLRFATFLAWFPQLVAGPIVRGSELLPQLANLPDLARGQVGQGVFRLARGLVKKLLFADVLRVGIVDPLFADPTKFTGLELLVGLYAYTLQIYCDFSAYTDMAIGSGRLFGIELPENFRRPYRAVTITDFWRRWHITLSLWVRHYIYFPLGGAQVRREWHVYRNLVATFVVIGVWHGASWNFVLYGFLHAVAMGVQRAFRKAHGRDPGEAPPGWFAFGWRWLLTFHFVVLARILFRAPGFDEAAQYTAGLLAPGWVMPRFSHLAWAALVVGYVAHFTPERWAPRLERWFGERSAPVLAAALAAAAVACATLGTGEQLEFIYYQF